MAKINISDFNIRITINQLAFTQDEGGGNIQSIVKSWTVWADKKDPFGNQITFQSQQTWNYDTKFKIRYNPVFKVNYSVIDATGTWTINNISVVSAGYKEFMILNCSKINDDLS